MGAKVLRVDQKCGRVDLGCLVSKLGKMNIDSILIEGGGTLNYSALEEGIVDKIELYIAPKIIGGTNSKTFVEGVGISKLSDAFNVNFNEVSKVGEDILIEGYIGGEN